MKRTISVLAASALMLSLAIGDTARACGDPPPVVSPAWLASHGASGLSIIDIRTADEYATGHLRGAISIPFEVPFSAWITMRDDLLLELPEAADLTRMLGESGISKDSQVVIVSSIGEPPYPQAGATRVAVTLGYAGVRRVSILDGGYPRWVAEGRATTTDVPSTVPVSFDGTVNGSAFVDIDYVRDRTGTAVIVDARDASVYSGEVVESWADKPGHIPSAVSLPAVLIWNADGTYRGTEALAASAREALGRASRSKEIIVYCGVGGYASSWLFVLTRVLGYERVRMYDGAAQEWVRYYDMEL